MITTIPADRLCRCLNCGHEDDLDTISLDDVDNLHSRLDPGCTVPAGECSACGCLSYLASPKQEKDLAALLREAAGALEALDDACRNNEEHRDLIQRLHAEANERHEGDTSGQRAPAPAAVHDPNAAMSTVIAQVCGYFSEDGDHDAGLQQIVQSAHAVARDLRIQPATL